MEKESKKRNELLVVELIKQKSLSEKFAFKSSFAPLVESGILKKDGEFLELSFSYACSSILISEFLQEPTALFSVKTIDEALPFVKRVVKKMNDAGITAGTHSFKKYFLKEFIVSSFSIESLIREEIIDLKFGNSFHELVEPVCLAIPELPITAEQAYQIFRFCYQKGNGAYSTIGAILETFSLDHGSKLVPIALSDIERPAGMMAHVLCGYYPKNPTKVWEILNDLIVASHEREVVFAITRLPLQSSDEIKKAIDLLEKIRHNTETQNQLVFAYAALITLKASDEPIKNAAVQKLYVLAESGDAGVVRSISYRLIELPIKEEIKVEIVSKFNYQLKGIRLSVFHMLQSINPVLWFSVLRKICLTEKMDFDPDEITHALTVNYDLFKDEFSQQLISLMTDDKGLVRYGGCKILQEMNKNGSFVFHSDLISLAERDQLMFIEALLTDFLHPEKVIRFLLVFRKSPYTPVLQAMINNCALLIEDYMGQSIEAFRNNLDKTIELDAQVLKIVEDYYSQLSRIVQTKSVIREFSPVYSQASLYLYYRKMAQDRMREQMNVARDNDKNSIFSLVSKVIIARGRYWKLEGKDKPTPLSTIKKAITFPRTYFLNPDSYNWSIKIKILKDFNGRH